MKFEIGDRVAVYEENRFGRETGTIEFIGGDIVSVNTQNWGLIAANMKQCRRLVSTPRRRIWVPKPLIEKLSMPDTDSLVYQKLKSDFVEFVEVSKRSEE